MAWPAGAAAPTLTVLAAGPVDGYGPGTFDSPGVSHMIMVEYFKLVVTERYAKFDGRAGRAEYWWFFLLNIIISFVLQLVAGAADALFILPLVYSLALLIPGLAVAIRRLHDTDKSGWWLLIAFVPFVGFIVLIVFLATEGTAGANQYGEPDPGLPATV